MPKTKPHSNGLTAAEQEALELLAEECSEVVKAAMKMLRHGKQPTDHSVEPPVAYDNVADLLGEIQDVLASIYICRHVGLVETVGIINDGALRERLRKKLPYLHHIDTTGLLD